MVFKNKGAYPCSKKKMLEKMGEEAYRAYCIQLEYKDENGNQLKSWKRLSSDVKDAWVNASLLVLRSYEFQKA